MYSWLIKPFNDFLAMKQSNRFSHALLICGSSGLGINELTYEIARTILCEEGGKPNCCCHSCQMLEASTHPDFTKIVRDGNNIKVDQIRSGILTLEETATNAHGKVLLIEDAELMNEQASNALLKTLEEPPTDSFIILSTGAPRSLLPTILSRTMRLDIGNVPLEVLNDFLRKETSSNDDFTLELRVSGFNPLKVKEYLENGDSKNLRDALLIFNDVILGNAQSIKFVQAIDKKLSKDLVFSLFFAIIKDVMLYQVGGLSQTRSILKNEEVLQRLATIHPDSLNDALNKIIALKKVPGIPNSMVNNLQILSFVETLKGDDTYVEN